MMRKKMTMMMMMLTILVWCEREVNTGDVEVDVGKAGEEGRERGLIMIIAITIIMTSIMMLLQQSNRAG